MNHPESQQTNRPRVVIVGGGFAGQAVARELRRAPVDILLIDKNNFQTFQPLLYQVATAALEPEKIVYPIRGAFKKQQNLKFRLGSVIGVDWKKRVVLLAGQDPVPFDFLVFAAGSTPNYFNIPGADVNCFPLKHLSDAVELRNHVLRLFEEVDRNPALIKNGLLNVVIVGGGPTGVEMAGSVHELFNNTLRKDFPDLPIEKAKIVLVEASDSLLGPFDEESRNHAYETLKERGIHIACGERVVRVTEKAVYLDSKKVIPTATAIWAVGVRASPLADILGLKQTRGGRIAVNDNLSVPGRPHVFVAGDMAGSIDEGSGLHPQLASVARQGGHHVAQQIIRTVKGQESTAFEFKSPGIMATIGRHSAVAEFPGDIRLEGFTAWFTWLSLHLMLLSGFRNRLHVLISWLGNYFTKDRTSRLIFEMNRTQQPAAQKQPAQQQSHLTKPIKAQLAAPVPRPISKEKTSTQLDESLVRIQQLLNSDEFKLKAPNVRNRQPRSTRAA